MQTSTCTRRICAGPVLGGSPRKVLVLDLSERLKLGGAAWQSGQQRAPRRKDRDVMWQGGLVGTAGSSSFAQGAKRTDFSHEERREPGAAHARARGSAGAGDVH